MKWLGVAIVCLTAAIAVRLAFDAKAQTAVTPVTTTGQERTITIQGKVADGTRYWLSIEAHNGAAFDDRGFEPSYTRIVSDYKPMFRKLASGQWEIMFTSEIAEELP